MKRPEDLDRANAPARVPITRFEADPRTYDELVLRAPDVDPFCSSSVWTLAGYRAWSPDADPLVLRFDNGYGLFLVHGRGLTGYLLTSFDSMWGFACPLIGEDPDALATEFTAFLCGDAGWRIAFLSGLSRGSRLYQALIANWRGRFLGYECAHMRVWRASLAGGLVGYLGRRTRKFRENARRARRRAGDKFVLAAHPVATLADADELMTRILRVEQQSWKGRRGTGLGSAEMERFYRYLVARLGPERAVRAMFATMDGRDVGYILGARIADTYRGFQISYDAKFADYSLGNLLQLAQIESLAAEGALVYDLGMDMPYKARWAETPVDTYTLSAMREDSPS